MKKSIALIACIMMLLLAFASCDGSEEAINSWDCSVECASSDPTTITYCNDMIKPTSEVLEFINQNDFDIKISVVEQYDKNTDTDNSEYYVTIKAGEKAIWDKAVPDAYYEIGIKAGVKEGTDIHLMVNSI